MFKKIIILSLALLYINVASGIGIQFHYCMGNLVSMAIGHGADHDDACGDCGMDTKESSCCKDESFLFKVKDGHQPSTIIFHSFKFIATQRFDFSVFDHNIQSFQGHFSFADHNGHSLFHSNKQYLVLRVFRI